MDYQTYFQLMRQENDVVVIVFFKTFQKIIILPERFSQFLSFDLKLDKSFLEFKSVAYGQHTKYPFGEKPDTRELNIRYTAIHHYSDIVGLVTYTSEALATSTVLTAKDFDKVSDKVNDEIEIICERLVK